MRTFIASLPIIVAIGALTACSDLSPPEMTSAELTPTAGASETPPADLAAAAKDIPLADTVMDALKLRDFARMAFLMETEPDEYGMRRQFYPYLGRAAAEIDPEAFGTPPRCSPARLAQLQDGAVEAILAAAEDHRVIIVNEDHSRPQHRAFIGRLLPGLAERGFTHYAAETFSLRNHDGLRDHAAWQSAVAARGYLLPDDGNYTQDPVFAQTVRDALSLGLTPVAYETERFAPQGATMAEQVALRETEQARNLWDRVLSDPDARVLIHVGFSHARKTPDAQGNIWMAQRLVESYGVDPFTINQTGCTDAEASDGWRYATSADPADGFDMHVHSMPERIVNGRQGWLAGPDRVRVSAQGFIPDTARERMAVIEVRDVKQPDLMLDRALVRPGETVDLMLPYGPVMVTTYGERRTVLAETRVTTSR
ncbi:hypothetical protein ACFFUB_00655 [Algimonas porphyrae]|uniref:Lipoprotein n=1 Tax=Algimonas porphyrae TaxID=1128113 RepID=A0ABQ5V2T6_9PROT|nr:hypothetical protein [Algimonas porphyrae]GLQ20542.1 hypothetical protein GCM10007854_14970 [Algimonas porphyrae]